MPFKCNILMFSCQFLVVLKAYFQLKFCYKKFIIKMWRKWLCRETTILISDGVYLSCFCITHISKICFDGMWVGDSLMCVCDAPTPPKILVWQAPMRWALTAIGRALTPYRLWRRLGLFLFKFFTLYPIFFPLPSDNCFGHKNPPRKTFQTC